MKTSTLVACMLLSGSVARASVWVGGIGDWGDSNNWQGAALPGSGDLVYVSNGGTAQVNGDYTISRLFPGWDAGTTGTVDVQSGTLESVSASTSNIGQNGAGILTLSGGTFKAAGIDGTVGASSSATINLQDGKLISTGLWNASRNNSDLWSFNMTGGTLSVLQLNYGNSLAINGTVIAPGDVGAAGYTRFGLDGFQINSGGIHLDIGGTVQAPGTAWQQTSAGYYDFIYAWGLPVTLGGDATFSLINGFIPDPSDTFRVLGAGSITGFFDNVADGGRISQGIYSFQVDKVAVGGGFAIELSNFAAIPEPSTLPLLIVGFGLLRWAIRRR